mgnify:CR=1 FL=1|tara:strand:- start:150 stop:1226 length:1077 start_codon:yes stop_codon:yes gene_type:complete
MKNILLLIFGIIIISCSSKVDRSKHLQDLNIYGNVKSITENSYEAFENKNKIEKGAKIYGWKRNPFTIYFNDKGYKIKEIETRSDGITIIQSTFKYNSKDSLIEEISFNSSDNPVYYTKWEYNSFGQKTTETRMNKEYRILSQKKWNYDKKNILIEEKYFGVNDYSTIEYDSEGNEIEVIKHHPISLKSIKLLKYDKNERVIEEKTTDESNSSWKVKFSYENNNKPKEETMYNSNDIMTLKWSFKHHKNEQVSEKTGYKISKEGKTIHISSVIHYSEKGREIDDVYYDSEGTITSQDSKKYNDNRDLIENLLYTSDNTMTGTLRYTYKYDNKNNWIERIEYWNEYPNTITERKIDYYN